MLVNNPLYSLLLRSPLHVRDRHKGCESYRRSPWPAQPLHEYF